MAPGRIRAWPLAAVLLATPLASGAPQDARDAAGATPLMRAARASDVAALRALLAAGADVDAARASGATALTDAAAGGSLEAARLLLDAGARPDPRDRADGTPLDVAERAGRVELAALLRSRGARGSGRSVGDRACIRPWRGDGYCGRIEAVEGTRYRIRVDAVLGCAAGCAADSACSAGREVGGSTPDAVQESQAVWTRSWCLTQIGLP